MKWASFDNIWVVRGVALFFTLLLYIFVTSGNNQQFQSAMNQQFASVDSSETISNMPVFLGEHDDDLYISGLPETVDITLRGPRNLLSQLSVENFRVETEDLTDLPSGARAIRLVADGLPEEITYEINPSRVMVRLSRKASITVPVEYEFTEGTIADGYQVTSVTLNPTEVVLTGDSTKIDTVDRAVVRISSEEPLTESFSATHRLQILDANNNLLDINTEVADIQVAVEIEAEAQSANVPLNIVAEGENTNNFNYAYSLPNQTEIGVVAAEETLAKIDVVNVIADVTDLTESATIAGQVQMPDGAIEISNSAVDVSVSIEARIKEDTSARIPDEVTETSIQAEIESSQETSNELELSSEAGTEETSNGSVQPEEDESGSSEVSEINNF